MTILDGWNTHTTAPESTWSPNARYKGESWDPLWAQESILGMTTRNCFRRLWMAFLIIPDDRKHSVRPRIHDFEPKIKLKRIGCWLVADNEEVFLPTRINLERSGLQNSKIGDRHDFWMGLLMLNPGAFFKFRSELGEKCNQLRHQASKWDIAS